MRLNYLFSKGLNMKFSKITLISLILFSSNSFGQGIPTIDSTSIANQIQTWKIEADRWLKTVDEYKKQYQAQLEQIATQTGARDIIGFVNEAKKQYDNVKDLKQWVDNPEMLLTYGKDALSSELRSIYDKYGMTSLCDNHIEDEARKLCEGQIILTATKEQQNKRDLDRVNDRVETINKIADRMSNATDTKEAQDLSNAMQTQIALLQADNIQRDIQVKQQDQQERLTEQKIREKIIKDIEEATKDFETF